MDILDRELLLFGQFEEAAGHVQHCVREPLRDAMASQVQEPDLMHGVAQFVTKPGSLLRARVQSGEVDYGQCFEWQRLQSFSANFASRRMCLLS